MKRKPISNNLGNVSSSEGGVLALLLHTIIADKGYDKYIDILVNRAVESDLSRQNSDNGATITKITRKGQYMQNINASSITWKTFISIISKVLRVKNFRITIELEQPQGGYTTHTVEVDTSKFTLKGGEPKILELENLKKSKETKVNESAKESATST